MAIQFTYKDEADIPEDLLELYKPPDGNCDLWYLDLGDDV